MICRIACAALVLLLVAAPAMAQEEEKAAVSDAERLVGAPWEITNAARDKTCLVTFLKDRTRGGSRIEFDAECAAVFPITKDITAWKFADSDLLRLLDARGKTLIEFSEVESGTFEAPTQGVGLLFLQPPGSSEAPQQVAMNMAGDWALRRAGKTLCELSFSDTQANEAFALSVKPGCDGAIARLGFSTWSMDQGELVITPMRGNVWRFEAGVDGGWARVPETSDPITLVRP